MTTVSARPGGAIADLAPVAPLPAATNGDAQARSLALAFDAALALERRFDLVLRGHGRYVETMPEVERAQAAQVGDGSLQACSSWAFRGVAFFGAPVGLLLVTAFGTLGASPLALVVAGVAPVVLGVAPAVRCLLAAREAQQAVGNASKRCIEDNQAGQLTTFIASLRARGDCNVDGVARALVSRWAARGLHDGAISGSVASELQALCDTIAQPATDAAVRAEHLITIARVARTVAGEPKLTRGHIAILRQALAPLSTPERTAIAPALRALLEESEGGRLRADLLALAPAASQSKIPSPPISTEAEAAS